MRSHLASAALAAATAASIATGPFGRAPDRGEPLTGFTQPVRNDLFLYNGTAADLGFTVRELRPELDLNCQVVAENPGYYLRDAAFGTTLSWELPPGTNAPLRTVDGGCHAVLIEGLGEPLLGFWEAADFTTQNMPQNTPPEAAPDGVGVIAVRGPGEIDAPDGLFVDRVFDGPEVDDACVVHGDAVQWSDPVWGKSLLTAVDYGTDGCLRLDLEQAETTRFYLCMPEDLFPYEAGTYITVDDLPPRGLRITQDDGPTLDVLGGVRGLGFDETEACAWVAEDECGTVSRARTLLVGDEQIRVGTGETVEIDVDGDRVQVFVARAEDWAIADPMGCNTEDIGPYQEIVTLTWPGTAQ